TVVATVSTGNLAIGVLGGIVMMFILPARLKQKARATEEKSSPVQEK
ncbi:SulP family inorganic anion transporter, partial [Enterobacter hormaechei]|nr:SulP family inorganic anion transporter [Enterobacter hormaechei]